MNADIQMIFEYEEETRQVRCSPILWFCESHGTRTRSISVRIIDTKHSANEK